MERKDIEKMLDQLPIETVKVLVALVKGLLYSQEPSSDCGHSGETDR